MKVGDRVSDKDGDEGTIIDILPAPDVLVRWDASHDGEAWPEDSSDLSVTDD